ncbi:hypothetical protein [Streptomyces sp. NPDC002722]|uniref:hypothetical protein n=1 Tax=Streptomyces sp. NPDC002722 TaxID=3154425 RepID=UPI00332BC1F7
MNRKQRVLSPRSSTFTSPKSTSAATPGRCAGGMNTLDGALPATTTRISGRRSRT